MERSVRECGVVWNQNGSVVTVGFLYLSWVLGCSWVVGFLLLEEEGEGSDEKVLAEGGGRSSVVLSVEWCRADVVSL